MSRFRVGIVGCGRAWRSEDATGAGMAHALVKGCLTSADCALVAAAYVKQENTELISAACESSRRRQRSDLPLRIEDSPASMLQDGTLTTSG